MDGDKTTELSLTDLVNFLDEERRKDKALLLEIMSQLESQAAHLSQLASRGVGLEDQILGLQSELSKIPSLDETLQRVKEEVTQILERYREERRRNEAEALALRQRDRQEQVQALQAFREEISGEVERLLTAQKTETERLAQMLVQLRQEMGARLEKEREHHRRIDYLEGWAAQSAKKIGELELAEQERAKVNAQFLEKLRSQDDERRKAMEQLRREFEALREKLSSGKPEREAWRKNRQEAEQLLGELKKLEKDLRARRNDWEELLKTESARLRKEWGEWSKDAERSLAKTKAALERQAARENTHLKELLALWRSQAEHFHQQLNQTEEWLKALEEKLRLLG